MDWGLGNPNKTAALIAMMMVAVWGLAFIRRWGFWLALTLFAGLGVCLVHTFSRGGMVALFFGMIPLLWMAWRCRISRVQIIGLVIAAWVVIGAAVGFQAHQRYTQGIIQEDRSITNRLAIWEMAPQMMRDAPGGWGIGNSGNAYCQWYQPLDRTEGYRTLVNSHLTWLVELGLLGRYAYLLFWLVVLTLCIPSSKQLWLAIPLGIWIIFGTSAVFSSVAESKPLWILPLLSLVVVIVYRAKQAQWLDWRLWCLPPSLAAILLVSIMLCPSPATTAPVYFTQGVIYVGDRNPESFLLYERSLFGNQPGRTFRHFMSEKEVSEFALIMNAESIPENKEGKLILGGKLTPDCLDQIRDRAIRYDKITVINPTFTPRQLFVELPDIDKINVIFGEFFHQGPKSVWEQSFPDAVMTLQGVGSYIPTWPAICTGSSNYEGI